jgi:hypothetical protein
MRTPPGLARVWSMADDRTFANAPAPLARQLAFLRVMHERHN